MATEYSKTAVKSSTMKDLLSLFTWSVIDKTKRPYYLDFPKTMCFCIQCNKVIQVNKDAMSKHENGSKHKEKNTNTPPAQNL